MAAMTKHTQQFRSLMSATILTLMGSGVAMAQLASDANGNTKAGTKRARRRYGRHQQLGSR